MASDNNINWEVSYEQAEAQVQDTVNKIYEHNMNDPTMTEEEARQSTAESAEKGLTYLEELQEAQQAELQAELSQGTEEGMNSGLEGGMEGGLEGGMDGGFDGCMDGGDGGIGGGAE